METVVRQKQSVEADCAVAVVVTLIVSIVAFFWRGAFNRSDTWFVNLILITLTLAFLICAREVRKRTGEFCVFLPVLLLVIIFAFNILVQCYF